MTDVLDALIIETPGWEISRERTPGVRREA